MCGVDDALLLCASHCGNDCEGGETLESGDGHSPGASEVVAVGVGGALDQAEHAQATQLARQPRRQLIGQQVHQVAARQAVDVELGSLHGAQQGLVVGVEEVQTLEGTLAVGLGLRDALEQALAVAVIVQAGEELEVTMIAAQQDFAQVDEAEE